MVVNFDHFDRYETPVITLCNPGSKLDKNGQPTYTKGVLPFVSDIEANLKFNAISELNLRMNKVSRDDETLTADERNYLKGLYNITLPRRLLYTEEFGYFIITQITDGYSESKHYKDITASSIEYEYQAKMIPYIENGTYPFMDVFNKVAGSVALWSWDENDIAEEVKARYRTFEDVDPSKNCLGFMLEDMQEAYECVFEFDTKHRKIKVYDKATFDQYHDTSVLLTERDLIDGMNIQEDSNDMYTAISVKGEEDGITLNAINPLGTSVIYNFDYYLSWMSKGLAERVKTWQDSLDKEMQSTDVTIADISDLRPGYIKLNKSSSSYLPGSITVNNIFTGSNGEKLEPNYMDSILSVDDIKYAGTALIAADGQVNISSAHVHCFCTDYIELDPSIMTLGRGYYLEASFRNSDGKDTVMSTKECQNGRVSSSIQGVTYGALAIFFYNASNEYIGFTDFNTGSGTARLRKIDSELSVSDETTTQVLGSSCKYCRIMMRLFGTTLGDVYQFVEFLRLRPALYLDNNKTSGDRGLCPGCVTDAIWLEKDNLLYDIEMSNFRWDSNNNKITEIDLLEDTGLIGCGCVPFDGDGTVLAGRTGSSSEGSRFIPVKFSQGTGRHYIDLSDWQTSSNPSSNTRVKQLIFFRQDFVKEGEDGNFVSRTDYVGDSYRNVHTFKIYPSEVMNSDGTSVLYDMSVSRDQLTPFLLRGITQELIKSVNQIVYRSGGARYEYTPLNEAINYINKQATNYLFSTKLQKSDFVAGECGVYESGQYTGQYWEEIDSSANSVFTPEFIEGAYGREIQFTTSLTTGVGTAHLDLFKFRKDGNIYTPVEHGPSEHRYYVVLQALDMDSYPLEQGYYYKAYIPDMTLGDDFKNFPIWIKSVSTSFFSGQESLYTLQQAYSGIFNKQKTYEDYRSLYGEMFDNLNAKTYDDVVKKYNEYLEASGAISISATNPKTGNSSFYFAQREVLGRQSQYLSLTESTNRQLAVLLSTIHGLQAILERKRYFYSITNDKNDDDYFYSNVLKSDRVFVSSPSDLETKAYQEARDNTLDVRAGSGIWYKESKNISSFGNMKPVWEGDVFCCEVIAEMPSGRKLFNFNRGYLRDTNGKRTNDTSIPKYADFDHYVNPITGESSESPITIMTQNEWSRLGPNGTMQTNFNNEDLAERTVSVFVVNKRANSSGVEAASTKVAIYMELDTPKDYVSKCLVYRFNPDPDRGDRLVPIVSYPYFNHVEYAELQNYIHEGDYTDEYVVFTDGMDNEERFNQLVTLYTRARDYLDRISHPTKTFDLDTQSFVFSKDFEHMTEQLSMGSIINVELDDGRDKEEEEEEPKVKDNIARLYLIGSTVNYEDNSFSMEFGNRIVRGDQKALLDNLLDGVSSTANTVSYTNEALSRVGSRVTSVENQLNSEDAPTRIISTIVDLSGVTIVFTPMYGTTTAVICQKSQTIDPADYGIYGTIIAVTLATSSLDTEILSQPLSVYYEQGTNKFQLYTTPHWGGNLTSPKFLITYIDDDKYA